jgi:hypothetical protein
VLDFTKSVKNIQVRRKQVFSVSISFDCLLLWLHGSYNWQHTCANMELCAQASFKTTCLPLYDCAWFSKHSESCFPV